MLCDDYYSVCNRISQAESESLHPLPRILCILRLLSHLSIFSLLLARLFFSLVNT